MHEFHPIIFILGPTASGKSRLAHQLALSLRAKILNCDSVQAYKYVDIGTAKPSFEERLEVPHLLFDFVEPPHDITAGQFRELAREEIEKHLPWSPLLAVGGSGFYIRALQSKMYEAKDITPEALQKIYELEQEEGLEGLYLEMLRLDSKLKDKIAAQDTYRVKRALGLMWSYNQSLSDIREKNQANQSPEDWPYKTIKIGLEISREILRERVRQRVELMLEAGWLDEIRELIERGYGEWAPLKSVGYKEMTSYLKGEMSLEDAKDKTVISTMQLAKRQMTWFRKETDIHWVDASSSFEDIQSLISGLA